MQEDVVTSFQLMGNLTRTPLFPSSCAARYESTPWLGQAFVGMSADQWFRVVFLSRVLRFKFDPAPSEYETWL